MSSIFFHCTTVLFGCCSAGAQEDQHLPTSRRPSDGCCSIASIETLLIDCVDRILDLLPLPTSCIPEIGPSHASRCCTQQFFGLIQPLRSARALRFDRQQLQQQLQQHASLLWMFIVCFPLSHTAVLNPLHLLCFGRGRCDGAAVARAHSSLCIVYFRLALPQYTL